MRDASQVLCEVSLPVSRAVIVGDRLERQSRPFHQAVLVSIVEFGGEISIQEVTDHLFPGAPLAVLEAVVRELEKMGLVVREGSLVVISEEGLAAIAGGRLPRSRHGIWSVRWIDLADQVQILAVDPLEISTRDLYRLTADLSNEGELNSMRDVESRSLPDSLIHTWNFAVLQSEEFLLSLTSGAQRAARTSEKVNLLFRDLGDGVSVSSIDEMGREKGLSATKSLQEWFRRLRSILEERIPTHFSLDELSDLEVMTGERTILLEPVSIRSGGECVRFEVSGIKVDRSIAQDREWALRHIAIHLTSVPGREEWLERVHEAKTSFSECGEILPLHVAKELERRQLRHSDQWWNVVASIDWSIE